jgi:hypothetical protein
MAKICQAKSRRGVTCGEFPGDLVARPGFPILPFAEIYTVIVLVSIDPEGGARESPVYLEGHRLVHGRLVGRVSAGRRPWPNARSDDPDKMALYIHSHFSGLGFAISVSEGSSNHRRIFVCTPVADGYSDMFSAIWWPRLPGATSDVPPDSVLEQVERQFLGTVWDDLNIWRHQEYIEHPALSKVDAKTLYGHA